MRILHAAIFNEDGCGRSYYAIDYKLNRAFTALGHYVLPFSYRDVARRANPLGIKRLGVGAMNRRLLETARLFQPDLVLVGKGELIDPATLGAIREALPDVRLALWSCDPVNHVEAALLALAPHAEAVFLTMTGAAVRALEARAGVPCRFIPNPVDPGVEEDFAAPAGAEGPSLVWVGSTIREAERGAFARWVAAFPGGAVYATLGRPRVVGADYLRLLGRARIVAGYNRHHDVPWYCSDRTSHVMGCGGFLLTRHFLGIEDFFERGVHCDWFETLDECGDLARRYLADDALRRRVAEAGREHVHEIFAHTKVARHMLNCILDGDDGLYPVPPGRASAGPAALGPAGGR